MAQISEILAGNYGREWTEQPWRTRRRRWLSKYGSWCRSCRRSDVEIHVHHVVYRKGKRLADASDAELTALCRTCHTKWHAVFNNLKQSTLGHVPVNDFSVIAGAITIGSKLYGPAYFQACAELVSSPGLIKTLSQRFQSGGGK